MKPLRLELPERLLDESLEVLHLVDVIDSDRFRRIVADDFGNLVEDLLLGILQKRGFSNPVKTIAMTLTFTL